MDAAHTIRDAVARVVALRAEAQANPMLQAATTSVKRFQARRFAGTYADLLGSQEFGGAARFFLEELYSDRDYSQRDAQFARIAGTLQTLFPKAVVGTAVSLAQLHILTEELDHHMARLWANRMPAAGQDIAYYVKTWQDIGRPMDRALQLDIVLKVGQELDRLTRTPGLRLMLKMMRRPAMAAGMGSLQNFLEVGFDTFASMSGKGARATAFLETIRERETAWITQLFASEQTRCEEALRVCLENTG